MDAGINDVELNTNDHGHLGLNVGDMNWHYVQSIPTFSQPLILDANETITCFSNPIIKL